MSSTPEIDIEQLDRTPPGDVTVIDVREPREYVSVWVISAWARSGRPLETTA